MASERALVSRKVKWFAGLTLGPLAALIVWAVVSGPPTMHTVHASSSPEPVATNVAPTPPQPPREPGTGLGLGSFQKITKRCKKSDITEDSVNGQPRFMCGIAKPAAHIFEAIGDRNNLRKITVLVPMGGNTLDLLKQVMVGVEFFQGVMGRKIGEVAPDGWLRQIAAGPTHFEYQGLSYDTTLIPSMGILYTISKS